MYEDRSGSPFVTPTFQSVLNHQIRKIVDSLDAGDPIDSFLKIRTLILMLNPTDSRYFMENDVKRIHSKIQKAQRQKSVDLYQTRRTQAHSVRSILRQHILDLFYKVMTRLHEGGYLEKKPLKPRAKGPSRLRTNL